jgi:hypothetical protein
LKVREDFALSKPVEAAHRVRMGQENFSIHSAMDGLELLASKSKASWVDRAKMREYFEVYLCWKSILTTLE